MARHDVPEAEPDDTKVRGSSPGTRNSAEPLGAESQEDELRDAPLGAIAITTFLAITILVFWFGMYFLNIARSS